MSDENLPIEGNEDKTLIGERDARGRFVKGHSGNPKGREKGSKNRIKQLQLAHEQALREYLSDPEQQTKVLNSLDRMFSIAEHGDDAQAIAAMKLLMDRLLPKAASAAEDDTKQTPSISINVHAPSDEKPVGGVTITPPEADDDAN